MEFDEMEIIYFLKDVLTGAKEQPQAVKTFVWAFFSIFLGFFYELVIDVYRCLHADPPALDAVFSRLRHIFVFCLLFELLAVVSFETYRRVLSPGRASTEWLRERFDKARIFALPFLVSYDLIADESVLSLMSEHPIVAVYTAAVGLLVDPFIARVCVGRGRRLTFVKLMAVRALTLGDVFFRLF
jgi:hypothetical protein